MQNTINNSSNSNLPIEKIVDMLWASRGDDSFIPKRHFYQTLEWARQEAELPCNDQLLDGDLVRLEVDGYLKDRGNGRDFDGFLFTAKFKTVIREKEEDRIKLVRKSEIIRKAHALMAEAMALLEAAGEIVEKVEDDQVMLVSVPLVGTSTI